MEIRFLPQQLIDRVSWDDCVSRSVEPLPYGLSDYLDQVSEGWDGLVLGKYEAVMPLPNHRRFGLRYACQPYFCQQGGIFAPEPVSPRLVQEFLDSVPGRFRYLHLHLNVGNPIRLPGIHSRNRVTHHLDLSDSYSRLKAGYSSQTRKNLIRSAKCGVRVHQVPGPERAFTLFRAETGEKKARLPRSAYRVLERVLDWARRTGTLEVWEATSGNGELITAALFIQSGERLIYLAGASTPGGREVQSMTALFDHLIHQKCEKPLLLDFEGSMIPGVARFFKGFGAAEKPFAEVILNRLPWPIRWVKGTNW